MERAFLECFYFLPCSFECVMIDEWGQLHSFWHIEKHRDMREDVMLRPKSEAPRQIVWMKGTIHRGEGGSAIKRLHILSSVNGIFLFKKLVFLNATFWLPKQKDVVKEPKPSWKWTLGAASRSMSWQYAKLIMLVMLRGSSSLHIQGPPVRLGTPHIRTMVQAREGILNYKQRGPLPPTSQPLITG